MKIKVLYFEPEDWVAFRSNTRFELGSVAKLSFPTIETFLGAVRTAILRKNKVDINRYGIPEKWKKIIGDSNSTGKIKMIGPFIYQKESNKIYHYFPAPLNLIKYRNGENDELRILKPHKYFKYRYLDKELCVPWSMERVSNNSEIKFVEKEFLEEFRKGRVLNNFREGSNIYSIETKIGVALEQSCKKTREGMLYSINIYRFKENSGFFCFINDELANLIDGINEIFLGMKQRCVKVTIGEIETSLFEDNIVGRKALCFLTPAILKGGFIPKDGKVKNTKIVSAIIGKKIVISGWNFEKSHPKPIYHAVPPGSIFYLEGSPGFDSSPFNESISDELADFGYGSFFTMNWDYIKEV